MDRRPDIVINFALNKQWICHMLEAAICRLHSQLFHFQVLYHGPPPRNWPHPPPHPRPSNSRRHIRRWKRTYHSTCRHRLPPPPPPLRHHLFRRCCRRCRRRRWCFRCCAVARSGWWTGGWCCPTASSCWPAWTPPAGPAPLILIKLVS